MSITRLVHAVTLALSVAAALTLGAGPARAQDLQGTLKKIKDSGTITLGYREQSVPFAFKGTDGSPAGYSVDLCRQVVGAIQQNLGIAKLEIKWVKVTPEGRISAVTGGSVDLECGSTTHTLSRQADVDFSLTTFVDGGSLLATLLQRSTE